MNKIVLFGIMFFLFIIRFSFAQSTYSLNSTNNTIAGQPTLFSLNWTSASGYIFSFSNGASTMINDTFRNFGEINEQSADTSPMVAMWHMNGGVSDVSGNNNNGQMKGTVSCSMPGKFGNACFFDNSPGDYVNIGKSINFDASANFTWNLWMKRSTATDWDVLMDKLNYNTSGLRLVIETDGTVSLLNSINEGPGTVSKVGTDQWYMITVVYTPTHQDIYINGTNMSTDGNGTFISNSDTNLTIGFSNSDSEQFSGYIDEVAIWNRSLSSAEILNLYNNGHSTWSNVTKVINSTVGANISWMIYANDSTNSWNTSSLFSFLTTGSPFLQWRNLGQSSSTVFPNETVVLSAQGYDQGYDNSSIDWAVLSTNESGSWQNQSWYSPLNLNNYTKWSSSNDTLDLSVVVDDIDGNGKPKIITCGYYYNSTDDKTYAQLRIWNYTATNSTSGSLNLESELDWTNDTTYCYSVKVDDLNHDGHKKIITGGATGVDWNNADLRIFNYTNGQINLEAIKNWYIVNVTSHTVIFTLTTADLNGDGKDEIITGGMYNETIYVSQLRIWNYTNNVINFVAGKDWYVSGRTEIESVRVAKLNNDGQPKIITGGLSMGGPRYQAELNIWNFTGGTINLENRTEWYLTTDTIIYSVAVGDLDQDGKLELVTGGLTNDGTRRRAQLRIWNYTQPTLNLENDYTWYVGANAAEVYSVLVQDINKDGTPEIVTAGMQNDVNDYGQVRIWTWMNNTLSLQRSNEWLDDGGVLEGEFGDSLFVSDLNNDGINEIVTGGRLESAPNYGILRVYSVGNIYGSPMNLTKIANTWLWSNFTWTNSSVPNNSVVGWRIYFNDTYGNVNATDIMTFTVGGSVADLTPPTFSNCFQSVTNNTAVNAGSTISVGCKWNDNVKLSMFVNSTKINNSGSFSNGTWQTFSAGNWSNFTFTFPNKQGSNLTMRIYANDTSNNQNVTGIWFWWNVSDNLAPTYTSNNSSLVTTYTPTAYSNFSITWSDGSFFGAYLENNFTGSLVNKSMNGSYPIYTFNTTSLKAGTYSYRFIGNDSFGNTNVTPTSYFTISKAATTTTLYLNNSQNNQNSVYPNATVNVTGTSSVTGLYVQIWRNGTLIANTTTTATDIKTWGAWNNNFTALTLGNENYSNSNPTMLWWNISKGGLLVTLYLNGSTSDQNSFYPNSTINVTATSNVSGFYVPIWRNNTLIINQTTASYNTATYSAWNNNFTTVIFGNENYTDSAPVTLWWNVSKGTLSLSITNDQTVIYPNTTTVSGTDINKGDSDINYTLYLNTSGLVNSSSVLGNGNISKTILLGAGSYLYTFNTAIGPFANWTINTTGVTSTLTVNQNPTNPIDIYLNNGTIYKNQNITITYGTSVTANSTLVYQNSGTALLWNDSSNVINPQTITPGAGTYAFKGNTSGNSNYSANNTGATYYIIVNKATPYTNLTINETSIEKGNIINITSWSSNLDLSTTIYTNFTVTLNNITLTTNGINTILINTSNLALGVYQISANTTGNENYNDNTTLETKYITVNDTTAPKYSDNSTNSTQIGFPTEFRLKWTDNDQLSGYIFSLDNCTNSFYNFSWTPMTGQTNWSNFTTPINETIGCLIRWCVYVNDSTGNENSTSCSDPFNLTTTDSIPPNITNVQAESITTSSATITWTTDEVSNSSLVISPSATYSNNSSMDTSHSISLSGLSASTTYYYNVSSCDASENCVNSTIYQFTSASVGRVSVGNSGIVYISPTCTENWTCTGWSTCILNKQTRVCSDKNKCGTNKTKPIESQSCTLSPACTENWTCTDWSKCVNKLQNRTCIDTNNCGTNTNKPIESQNCTETGPTAATAPTGLFLGLSTNEWIIAIVIGVVIALLIILFSLKRKKKNNH